ncbi:hypothetical protein [Bacillus thuringiensis]|uniref:hypothetical protein n=2 Tax=Bacillus thuringiensis TaxID=1428 RepID=UPI000BFC0DA7|nr:hypothetical protein [Bacillus thuringiensis]PGQ63404.1 hypothetical protein COA16_02410 [Bacillus thuringiensis]
MSWQCNEEENDVRIPEPEASHEIDRETKHFAEGEMHAILAKDEIVGAYLWGHLHGVHNDRYGETTYDVTLMVTAPSGRKLMFAPFLEATVKGDIRRPDSHIHCFGSFEPEGKYEEQIKKAIENNIELKIKLDAHRDRASVLEWLESEVIGPITEEIKEAFQQYLKGTIGSEAILDILNEGIE